MQRLNNITITMQMLILAIVVVFVTLATVGFFYVTSQNIIVPFFFGKAASLPSISLDSSLDEEAAFIQQRGEGLTVSSPSATLNNKEE